MREFLYLMKVWLIIPNIKLLNKIRNHKQTVSGSIKEIHSHILYFLFQDLKLINNDLTPKAIIDILSKDDPNVADGEGCCNLELEVTFLQCTIL